MNYSCKLQSTLDWSMPSKAFENQPNLRVCRCMETEKRHEISTKTRSRVFCTVFYEVSPMEIAECVSWEPTPDYRPLDSLFLWYSFQSFSERPSPRPMKAYCGRCLIAERWTTKLCTLWSIELSFSYLASNRTRSTSQVFDANELFPVISIFVSIIYIIPGERKQARKERKEARNKFPFHVFKSSLVLLLSARIMRSTSKRTNYMYNDCCLTHMQLKSLSLRLSHALDRINWKWKEYFLDIV